MDWWQFAMEWIWIWECKGTYSLGHLLLMISILEWELVSQYSANNFNPTPVGGLQTDNGKSLGEQFHNSQDQFQKASGIVGNKYPRLKNDNFRISVFHHPQSGLQISSCIIVPVNLLIRPTKRTWSWPVLVSAPIFRLEFSNHPVLLISHGFLLMIRWNI